MLYLGNFAAPAMETSLFPRSDIYFFIFVFLPFFAHFVQRMSTTPPSGLVW